MEEKFNASTQEVEDRLNAEITCLKEEHTKREAEWATELQNHQQAVHTLRAQIGHSKKEKGIVVEDLRTMTRKAGLLENKWKGMPLLNVLVVSKITLNNFNYLNHDFTSM
jgi:predicted type IV restriction endonuclease